MSTVCVVQRCDLMTPSFKHDARQSQDRHNQGRLDFAATGLEPSTRPVISGRVCTFEPLGIVAQVTN